MNKKALALIFQFSYFEISKYYFNLAYLILYILLLKVLYLIQSEELF